MRKSILVILAFIAVFSFCMLTVLEIQGAEIHGNAQFGYIEEIESFEAEINLQFVPYHWITFYGGINVLMEYYEDISFCPYRDTYIAGTKINFTKNIYADLYHSCTHSVYSNSKQFYDKFTQTGTKTMISVGIEW